MPDAPPSNTPAALAAGLSIAREPGLNAFHRFGPLVGLLLMAGLYILQLTGHAPDPAALQPVQAIITLLLGGWTARLGTTPPKTA